MITFLLQNIDYVPKYVTTFQQLLKQAEKSSKGSLKAVKSVSCCFSRGTGRFQCKEQYRKRKYFRFAGSHAPTPIDYFHSAHAWAASTPPPPP